MRTKIKKETALIVWVIILILGMTCNAFASNQGNQELVPPYNEPVQNSSFNPWVSFFRVVLGLIIVISLIFWFRKMASKSSNLLPQGRYISLVDGVGLSSNKAIYLVRLGDKCFLLGVTEQQISLLNQFESQDLEQLTELDLSQRGSLPNIPGQDFQNFLSQQIERLKKISSPERKGKNGR